jgi:hypothetical protein
MKKGQKKGEKLISKDILQRDLESKSKEQIAKDYSCSYGVIYRLLKLYNLKLGAIQKKCEGCGKNYIAQKTHGTYLRQKYCSEQCRYRCWIKTHPESQRAYSRKYTLSIPVFCRYCNKVIPEQLRKPGVRMCSDECRKAKRLKDERHRRDKISRKFDEFKRRTGCQACGYNKCSACLDFHHREPEHKLIRITASHWNCKTESIKTELKKCDLLCKNCHYEAHYKNQVWKERLQKS